MIQQLKQSVPKSLDELASWLQKDIDDWAHLIATLPKRPKNARLSYRFRHLEILLNAEEATGIEAFFWRKRAAKSILTKLIGQLRKPQTYEAIKDPPTTLHFMYRGVSVSFSISVLSGTDAHESELLGRLRGTLKIQKGC